MSKQIQKTWCFASSSSNTEYETLQYTDNSTSCNCPGWTRRVDANGNRSCKHTRLVDMGRADIIALSCHEYGSHSQLAPRPPAHAPKGKTTAPPAPPARLGARKLLLD